MFEQISDSFIAGILQHKYKKKMNRPAYTQKKLAERATQTCFFLMHPNGFIDSTEI